MTIRTRVTLWFAGILLASLLLMVGILHWELVGETEEGLAPESNTKKITDVLVYYGLPSSLVLLAGGFYLLRRAMRPIEDFTATAERIHAGNLSARIPIGEAHDELDRLASVFNDMLSRLEQGVESVRNFTINSSHELKTPLTILSAEAELALTNSSISNAERARLTSQLEEFRRLAKLVDALDFLARDDAGLPVLSRQAVDAGKLFEDAVQRIQFLTAPKQVTFSLVRCDAVQLSADSARLRQAFLNLLENAVKHNFVGGWIKAELRRTDRVIEIIVANSSAGIAADFLPRIFDRFAKGRASTEGSGLGLSITKAIVEAHAGTITCRTDLGEAVYFKVILPL